MEVGIITETRVCVGCGQSKYLEDFRSRAKCRTCYCAERREAHRLNMMEPAYALNYKRESRKREARRQEKRLAARREAGLSSTEPNYTFALLEKNASEAFQYWIEQLLPKKRVQEYFVKMGTPWDIPGLPREERCGLIMDEKTKVSVLDEGSRVIQLHGKYARGAGSVAIVDADRYDEINKHRWFAKPNGDGNCIYAARSLLCADGRVKTIWMHREVLEVGGADVEPRDTDHKNGNPLDNRRTNLRLVSRSVNVKNRFKSLNDVRKAA